MNNQQQVWIGQWFTAIFNQQKLILKGLQDMSARSDALKAAVAGLEKQSAATVAEVTALKGQVATLTGQVGEAADDAAAIDSALTALASVTSAEAAVAPVPA